MHKYLGDLLQKWKLKPDELSDEEKKTFDNWRSILEEEVTVDKIAEFCLRQQQLIESKWADKYRSRENDSYLADVYAIYGQIKQLIESKQSQRAQLEKQLEQMLDSDVDTNV